jgi:hypothetical protein
MHEQSSFSFRQNGKRREEANLKRGAPPSVAAIGEGTRKTLAKPRAGPTAEDLAGRKFGRLTVKQCAGRDKRLVLLWLCACDCGGEIITKGSSLKSNHTKSCGCLAKEAFKTSCLTHGKCKSLEYSRWLSMKARCVEHKNYALRGIKVCDRWLNSFEAFYEDMGCIPTPKHTLDRIDNDKGYEPANCRWATRLEQMNNTRKNRFITAFGRTQTMTQWARELNFGRGVIQGRIRRGGSGLSLLRPTA